MSHLIRISLADRETRQNITGVDGNAAPQLDEVLNVDGGRYLVRGIAQDPTATAVTVYVDVLPELPLDQVT